MSVTSGPVKRMGSTSPRLRFGGRPTEPRTPPGLRVLVMDDEPAFQLSFWCSTCPFLFRRLEGARDRLSLDALQDRLDDGLAGLDPEVIGAFSALLPDDEYLPLLLTVTPRLTVPMREGDYFSGEQVATWGVSDSWGLPEYPQTAYYRTFETPVSRAAHLFEFVVPMTAPAWNDRDRVAAHARRLASTSAPTAVAVSTLDVAMPAIDTLSTDSYERWGLTHFLLDGHHKMQAAAQSGRPLQLLALVAIGGSLASSEMVAALPALRGQQPAPRTPGAA